MLSMLAVLLLLSLLPAGGQNVKVVSQTCPDCGVTVYGRLLEPSDHKPGCQWYVGPEEESSEASHNHQHENESSESNKVQVKQETADPKPVRVPVTEEKPSTRLRDYTPAPAKPAVSISAPIMASPLAQPAPQFSGINEHNIVYDAPQGLAAEHPWGEVDMDWMRRIKNQGYDYLSDYDIERYTNTPGGTVCLGKRTPEGRTLWMLLSLDKDSGKYIGSVVEDTEDMADKKVSIQDIRFEAEGDLVVSEYSGGYKMVRKNLGGEVVRGYNIEVLPIRVDGHPIVAYGPDPSRKGRITAKETWLYNDKGQKIAGGEQLEYYDDAIIARSNDGTLATLYNWQGGSLHFDVGGWNSDRMEDIRCYKSDRGSYYVIKIREGRYALLASGFRQVGGIYASAEEAHAVWNNL